MVLGVFLRKYRLIRCLWDIRFRGGSLGGVLRGLLRLCLLGHRDSLLVTAKRIPGTPVCSAKT